MISSSAVYTGCGAVAAGVVDVAAGGARNPVVVVIVPLIVPLGVAVAVNDATESARPATTAVAVCVPACRPSVRTPLARPVESVLSCAGLIAPPPATTLQPTVAPATGFP